MMDIKAIQEMLPHRYPFLLVDRIIEVEPGVRAVGIKQVTATEFWCQGHFPDDPIMPGVLIAEALAQVAGIACVSESDERRGAIMYLVGFNKLRFRRPVRPGDTLRLEVEADVKRSKLWTFRVSATVDGTKVADGELMAGVA